MAPPSQTRRQTSHQGQMQQQAAPTAAARSQSFRPQESSASSPSNSLGSSSSEGPDSSRAGVGATAPGGNGSSAAAVAAAAAAAVESRSHRRGSVNQSAAPSSSVAAEEVPLLGGEKIVAVFPDLTYLCPYSIPGAMKGTLTLTNYKIFFSSTYKDSPLILDVPLGFVSRVEKVGGQRSTGENAYGLEIFCKDIRSLRFGLSKSEGHPRKDIFETVR